MPLDIVVHAYINILVLAKDPESACDPIATAKMRSWCMVTGGLAVEPA